jgi:hypothetical protein
MIDSNIHPSFDSRSVDGASARTGEGKSSLLAIANCLTLAAAKVLYFSSFDKTPLTVNRRG